MDNNERKNKTIGKSIRLKQELIDKIEILAENENRTFNNMVETLIIRSIKNRL